MPSGKEDSILTICPSRERPDVCIKMIESFWNTAKSAKLVIYLDKDDPKRKEYFKIISISEEKRKPLPRFHINKRMTTTAIFNKALKQYPDYKYYLLINDDVIFETKNWDISFIKHLEKKNGGVVYANDLLNINLPTFPCIDARMAKALGWLQLPTLNHLYGDNVWHYIATKLNKLFFMKHIVIEHRTWMNKKSQVDNVYKRTNSKEMYDKDQDAFRTWMAKDSENDIRKIKEILDGN